MKRSEQVALIAKQIYTELEKGGKLTEHKIKAAVDSALQKMNEEIVNSLRAGNKVSFLGLATIKLRDKPERTARNPQTGEVIKIAAGKRVAITSTKALKEATHA